MHVTASSAFKLLTYLNQHAQWCQVVSEGIAGFEERDPLWVQSWFERVVATSERERSDFASKTGQPLHDSRQAPAVANRSSLLNKGRTIEHKSLTH